MLTLGSLFDGSGGFPLAGSLIGIEPKWSSEIATYPLKVTGRRFPNMLQLGDITRINGADIMPVDIITFGSPCQGLSHAGSMKGIFDDERSCLFFEAIRVIKEMRIKTNGQYPRYLVWENVPGAFSISKGEDFRAVLKSFCELAGEQISIPRPEKGKWTKAGCIVGNGYSIAWRVYDAQYWGVAQRRKRIYALVDFGSERAGEILFKQESMSGDYESCNQAWQTAAGYDATGFRRSSEWVSSFIGGAESNDESVGCAEELSSAPQPAPNETNQIPDVTIPISSMAVYDCRGNGDGRISATITGDHQNRVTDYTSVVCCGNGQLNNISMAEQSNTLDCMQQSSAGRACNRASDRRHIIRRLTPLECCRLQGFPDWWTEGVERYPDINPVPMYIDPSGEIVGSDTAKYAMWGNGIALPCALDVITKIKTDYELYSVVGLEGESGSFYFLD